MANADKDRIDALNAKTQAFQAKVPVDDQQRRDISLVAAHARDEVLRLKGTPTTP
jgi:hypothetical protein